MDTKTSLVLIRSAQKLTMRITTNSHPDYIRCLLAGQAVSKREILLYYYHFRVYDYLAKEKDKSKRIEKKSIEMTVEKAAVK